MRSGHPTVSEVGVEGTLQRKWLWIYVAYGHLSDDGWVNAELLTCGHTSKIFQLNTTKGGVALPTALTQATTVICAFTFAVTTLRCSSPFQGNHSLKLVLHSKATFITVKYLPWFVSKSLLHQAKITVQNILIRSYSSAVCKTFCFM